MSMDVHTNETQKEMTPVCWFSICFFFFVWAFWGFGFLFGIFFVKIVFWVLFFFFGGGCLFVLTLTGVCLLLL